jgi:hypothetical protein
MVATGSWKCSAIESAEKLSPFLRDLHPMRRKRYSDHTVPGTYILLISTYMYVPTQTVFDICRSNSIMGKTTHQRQRSATST